MLLQIRHFIYDAMKHIVEQHGTARYRLLHNVEVIFYLYGLIRISIIGLMYLDSDQFPLYEYDYASAFVWKHRKICNKFFIIIAILLIMTVLLGIRTFYFHHVDTISFQIPYDCIVYNTDQYYKSQDTDENIAMKLSQRFENYQQQFARNHRLLSQIIPIANRVVSFKVWRDSWLEMDRVDRNLFENQNKMHLFPYASFKGRTYILRFVMIADALSYFSHIIGGKFLFCFCFLSSINQSLCFSLSNDFYVWLLFMVSRTLLL